MTDRLFYICVSFLNLLKNSFHITYQEISVIFNLYFQGGLLALTGVIPALAVVSGGGADSTAGVLLIVYAVANVLAFAGMLVHYHLPVNDAFDRCVNDLVRLAAVCRTSYNMVNVVIFIVLWLLLIACNMFLIIMFI